jgi:hypothetical protein
MDLVNRLFRPLILWSASNFFIVLRLVYQTDDICDLEVERNSLLFFINVFLIFLNILQRSAHKKTKLDGLSPRAN